MTDNKNKLGFLLLFILFFDIKIETPENNRLEAFEMMNGALL